MKLGELLKLQHGYAFKTENYVKDSNIRLVTLGNFNEENNFKYNDAKATYYGGEFPQEYILNEGDLIMPLTEQVIGLLGNSAFVPKIDNTVLVLNQRVARVKCYEDKLDKIYAHYLLASASVKKQLEAFASAGTKQRNISPNDVYEVEVAIPNLPVQKKIGRVLYDIEQKINLNNSICADLEAMAKQIYDYWFVQFDFPDVNGRPYKSNGGAMVYNEELKREIPAGWSVKTVDEYCDIFTGKKDVNQALESGNYRFYSCAPGFRYSNEKLYEGKAVLISGNGSYTGRTTYVDAAFDLYQRTYACVNKTEINVIGFIYFTLIRFFVPIVQGGTHGSAIPYIVFDDIAKMRFAMSENIIEQFQNRISSVMDEIIGIQNEGQELAELRDFLLPMLMNGQIKVEA